jgi:hypothetical protein
MLSEILRYDITRIIHVYLSCYALITRIGRENTLEDLEGRRLIRFVPVKNPKAQESSLSEVQRSFRIDELRGGAERELYARIARNVIEKFGIHDAILSKLEAVLGKLNPNLEAIYYGYEALAKLAYTTIVYADVLEKEPCLPYSSVVVLTRPEFEAIAELVASVSAVYEHVRSQMGDRYEAYERAERKGFYFSNSGFVGTVLCARSSQEKPRRIPTAWELPYDNLRKKLEGKTFVEYDLERGFDEAFDVFNRVGDGEKITLLFLLALGPQ